MRYCRPDDENEEEEFGRIYVVHSYILNQYHLWKTGLFFTYNNESSFRRCRGQGEMTVATPRNA